MAPIRRYPHCHQLRCHWCCKRQLVQFRSTRRKNHHAWQSRGRILRCDRRMAVQGMESLADMIRENAGNDTISSLTASIFEPHVSISPNRYHGRKITVSRGRIEPFADYRIECAVAHMSNIQPQPVRLMSALSRSMYPTPSEAHMCTLLVPSLMSVQGMFHPRHLSPFLT